MPKFIDFDTSSKTIDQSVRDTGDRWIGMRTDGILEQIVPDAEVIRQVICSVHEAFKP